MLTTSVTVTTTPTLLCAAKPGSQRQRVNIEVANTEARGIRVGPATVTTSTGHIVEPGRGLLLENDTLSRPAEEALYGICVSGTVTVTVIESA